MSWLITAALVAFSAGYVVGWWRSDRLRVQQLRQINEDLIDLAHEQLEYLKGDRARSAEALRQLDELDSQLAYVELAGSDV